MTNSRKNSTQRATDDFFNWINNHPLSFRGAPKRILLVFHTILTQILKYFFCAIFSHELFHSLFPTIFWTAIWYLCPMSWGEDVNSVLAELKRTQATDWALQKNVTIWWPDLSQNVTNNIPPQISDVGHVFSCLKLISEMNPRLYKLVLILSVLAKSQGTMY